MFCAKNGRSRKHNGVEEEIRRKDFQPTIRAKKKRARGGGDCRKEEEENNRAIAI